jgi:hypothetical protein
MKARISAAIFSFVLATLMISSSIAVVESAQEKIVEVTGRVIDRNGKGISEATVTIYYPPCNGCFEHLLPSTKTQKDGAFIIESPLVSDRRVMIFAEEPVPKGYWALYTPSVWSLAQDPKMGSSIKLSESETIELGDVRVHLRYGKVVASLLKCGASAEQDKSIDVRVELKNSNGKIVQQTSVPKTSIDVNASIIRLAIPVGRWELIVTVTGPQGETKKRLSVDVNSSTSMLQLC